jgi:transglutaminase-like putative cysteine protease
MTKTDVIAAGAASRPVHIYQSVVSAYSPGTWTTGADLGPGDSYLVDTYVPHPTAAQLNKAGSQSGDAQLLGYRTILLPQTGISATQPEIVFPSFHSNAPVESVIGLPSSGGAALVSASPYARAFALARALAARAPTSYAFAISVERYLARGFTYSEDPPLMPYPLESFLFTDRAGYCQQFSGAMALLLRMGGVPARVAAGFTSGTHNATTGRWVASDLDAHAWVEAWFPRYGWVGFDPTPAAAPARGGRAPIPTLSKVSGAPPPATDVRRPEPTSAARHGAKGRGGGSARSLPVPLLALAGLGLAALLAVAVATARAAARRSDDRLLPELERAFSRSGRRIAGGMTLAQLEHRFRDCEDAAAYVRAIRLRRFAAGAELPTARQRGALRAELRAGLGVAGSMRALWALPPQLSLTSTFGGRRSRA